MQFNSKTTPMPTDSVVHAISTQAEARRRIARPALSSESFFATQPPAFGEITPQTDFCPRKPRRRLSNEHERHAPIRTVSLDDEPMSLQAHSHSRGARRVPSNASDSEHLRSLIENQLPSNNFIHEVPSQSELTEVWKRSGACNLLEISMQRHVASNEKNSKPTILKKKSKDALSKRGLLSISKIRRGESKGEIKVDGTSLDLSKLSLKGDKRGKGSNVSLMSSTSCSSVNSIRFTIPWMRK